MVTRDDLKKNNRKIEMEEVKLQQETVVGRFVKSNQWWEWMNALSLRVITNLDSVLENFQIWKFLWGSDIQIIQNPIEVRKFKPWQNFSLCLYEVLTCPGHLSSCRSSWALAEAGRPGWWSREAAGRGSPAGDAPPWRKPCPASTQTKHHQSGTGSVYPKTLSSKIVLHKTLADTCFWMQWSSFLPDQMMRLKI